MLKYFIGYIDEDDIIKPLCLKLPEMIGYSKVFDDSMTMSLRVDDSILFKKYCKIWRTTSGLLGIEFDSEPVYGDTDSYIKTKAKMDDNRVNTNIQGKGVPKEGSSYKCLSLIMLDCIVKVGKNIIHKYFQKNVNMLKEKINYINDDTEITSSDENDEFYIESDSDSYN